MTSWKKLAVLCGTLLWSEGVIACPLCHSATAEEVRDGLSVTMRDKSIWIAMLLPFFAIGGVVRILNSGGKSEKDQ